MQQIESHNLRARLMKSVGSKVKVELSATD